MTNYEILLQEAQNNNVLVKEKIFKKAKGNGFIKGNKILINAKLKNEKEKSCTLAEELGHYHTTVGNILDQSVVSNRKQEFKARTWAYNKQIGLTGIINAYKAKCQNLFEMAEFLDVTEEFLLDALDIYRSKYGICVQLDNYVIYFIPNLWIMEIL